MNISLPNEMREEVDRQVVQRGYGTSSEYVRDLIRRDIERQRVRALLLQGRESPAGKPLAQEDFEALRARARANAQA